MRTANLNLLYLHAANLAASNEATRYYLHGVCVEIEPTTVTYVATDGHILFAYRDVDCGGLNELTGTWIIPSETIKRSNVSAKHRERCAAMLKETEGTKLELATLHDGGFLFHPIDGSFPEWRRVVPSMTDPKAEPHTFDPAFLVRLWKAGELIGASNPSLVPNGGGAAHMVYTDSNAFGLVMPRRADLDLTQPHDAPEWTRGSITAPRQIAA